MITRSGVKSSNIKSMGYDSANKIMAVEFHNGSIYEYDNVDKSIYQEIKGAKSIGSTFAKYKNNLSYRRVK